MIEGQIRAIKGSKLNELVTKFLEEKYKIKVDLFDGNFWIIGNKDNIKKLLLDSCRENNKIFAIKSGGFLINFNLKRFGRDFVFF